MASSKIPMEPYTQMRLNPIFQLASVKSLWTCWHRTKWDFGQNREVSFCIFPHGGVVFSLYLLTGWGPIKSDLTIAPRELSQSNNTEGGRERGEEQSGQTTQHSVENTCLM